MRSQLTDSNISNINGGNWVAKYSYHDNGDMAYRIIQSDSQSFSYNGHLMTSADGNPLDYDENGDMTNGVGATLVYNWDSKLRSGQKDGNSISLKYDPAGNRIQKNSTANGNRKYIVDIVGDLPVILLELDPNMAIKKTYIYANGEILAQHKGDHNESRYFYLHDRLGSVRQIISTSGNVVRNYTYQPFGETIESGGTLINPFMFSGQFFDDEIGQYYLRARQYDPYIYRFTSRDLVDGKFEEPMSLHKYLYCINNPINRIDPAGLWGTEIHNQIIDEAYPGLSQLNHRLIYEGSLSVDIYYQTSKNAYRHAMRAPGQSVEEAQEEMWGFVFDNLRRYEECLNRRDTFDAYQYLGAAMHPIMDWTDPAHNWQEWALWPPGYIISHEDPETIDRGTLNNTVLMMEQTMQLFELSEFLNFAIGE